MKIKIFAGAIVALVVLGGLPGQALAQNARFDELANLPLAEGRPTPETAFGWDVVKS